MKKIAMFGLVFLLIAGLANASANPKDINGDGNVNVLDLQLVANEISGRYDLNNDGKVNIADLQRLVFVIQNPLKSCTKCDINGDGRLNFLDWKLTLKRLMGNHNYDVNNDGRIDSLDYKVVLQAI